MTLPAFLIGALAGMLVLGLVWMTISFATGGDEGNRGGGDAGASAAGVADESGRGTARDDGGSAQPSRMDRCRRADAGLQAPLRSAAPAMDQWEVHVGAMNKLVVGAISLQQANAFWNQTRVGAQRKMDRFYDATRQLWRQGVDCPSPDRLGHASGALRSCAQRVTADLQALGAARTAMGTWNKHVKDMEMLRMGHLSPAAATQMWLASWRTGLEQLRTYQRTERALAGSGDC